MENDYCKIIRKMYGLKMFGSKFDLAVMDMLLDLMGNPHKGLKIIHVAGTNGKTSTSHMISSVLEEAGYKTGLYTSPHVHSLTERIKINSRNIPKKDLMRLVGDVLSVSKEVEKKLRHPTFFEVCTAMAFSYFKQKGVEFAVIETGLGGRLDATNVVNPLVSVITNIDLEHTQILGNDLASIAKEKAGIVKKGSIVVTAEGKPEALDVIRERCSEVGSELVVVREGLEYLKTDFDGFAQKMAANGYQNLEICMIGDHQIRNAAASVFSINAIKRQGVEIPDKAVRNGLKKTYVPGRLEIIQTEPNIVLDCAHNPAGISSLRMFLENNVEGKVIVVIGISSGKDIGGMIDTLSPAVGMFLVTRAKYRGAETSDITKAIKKHQKDFIVKETVSDSVKHALSLAGKDGTICITGSVYVVDEARRLWTSDEVDPEQA